MKNKIKFIQKNLKTIIRKLDNNTSLKKEKTLFNEVIQKDMDLIEKKLFFIKINKDELFIEYKKKPKGKNKKRVFTLDELLETDEEVYNELKSIVEKIYELFKFDLNADITINNYNDYLDTLEELILNKHENKIITNMPFSTSKLSSTLNIKQSGEEFGFGRFSSVSASFSITMAIPVENTNNFAKFARKIITHELNDILNDIKGDKND